MGRFHFTLRVKLAAAMTVVALLPLLMGFLVSSRVTLERVERDLREQTVQTARIALNLLLRQVRQVSMEAERIAADGELLRLVAHRPSLVARHLEGTTNLVVSGTVEVTGRDGRVEGRFSQGGERLVARLNTGPGSEAVRRALQYERFVTIMRVERGLAIQASAPLYDASFVVQGAVVITTPLGNQMADFIKGVVRAEIGFVAGDRPVASTFVNRKGKRLRGLALQRPEKRSRDKGESVYAIQSLDGHEYSVAYVPLQTATGERVGLIAAGVSRQRLIQTRGSIRRSLAGGAVGGLMFALLIASFLGRRITTPLARLHRSTRAVAAGDLDQEVVAETNDEIGDLAGAFQKMTAALREHRDYLERLVEDRTAELAQANLKLEELARTDGLTGLNNHRFFQEMLIKEVERSRRTGLGLSLLMIDVDHFKHYNDINGHVAGDEVLRQVARVLEHGRRLNDIVARYGGEEFTILLVDTPRSAAMTLADQVRREVAKEKMENEEEQPGGLLTISVGVASYPDDATTPEGLLRASDEAMYRAKRLGRNRVEVAGAATSEQAS